MSIPSPGLKGRSSSSVPLERKDNIDEEFHNIWQNSSQLSPLLRPRASVSHDDFYSFLSPRKELSAKYRDQFNPASPSKQTTPSPNQKQVQNHCNASMVEKKTKKLVPKKRKVSKVTVEEQQHKQAILDYKKMVSSSVGEERRKRRQERVKPIPSLMSRMINGKIYVQHEID